MDVYLPPKATDRFLLYLAGSDDEQTGWLEELAERHSLGVVCLPPRGAWWLPKPCRAFGGRAPEAYLMEQVVPALREAHGARRFGLAGLGMGGQGALRIAFKHARLFPAVAAVQPWVDFHERYWEDEVLQEAFADVETARQYTATLWINPLDRPMHIHLYATAADSNWYPGIQRLHEKLVAIGVPHEWEEFRGAEGLDVVRRAVERLVARIA